VATFSIDLRHPDPGVLRARGNAVEGVVQAAVRDVKVAVHESFTAMPVLFDSGVLDAVQKAAVAERLRCTRLPSGAFHDAQFAVKLAPTGMIFVPCRKGISHNPAEYSAPDQLAAGTRVLTRVLAELAG
jgi:N-carbamoyl-L-amino-acid hydrolase